MNNIEIIDLRVLCSVARFSSFVAAAHDLGISPAYVSKRIAELEQRLGVPLFYRSTRRVRISDQGEIAYAWARRILEDIDGMAIEMSDAKIDPSGPLRVSTSLRLGRNHVSPILAQLGKQYPRLEVWLELVNSRVDMIEDGIDSREFRAQNAHTSAAAIVGALAEAMIGPLALGVLSKRAAQRVVEDIVALCLAAVLDHTARTKKAPVPPSAKETP